MTTDTTTATPPPPRIFDDDGAPAREVCHRCGYPLIGLPRENACPECGQPALKGVFIAYHGGLPSPLLLLPSAVLFVAFYWLFRPNPTWTGTGLILVGVVTAVALQRWPVQSSDALPAPQQLRFNSDGFTNTLAHPFTLIHILSLMLSLVVFFATFAFALGGGAVLSTLQIGNGVALSVMIWWMWVRMPPPSIDSLRDPLHAKMPTIPWSEVIRLKIKDHATGVKLRFRYRPLTRPLWWPRFFFATIRATPDQRERLVAFITRAIEASGSGARISRVRKEAP